LLETALPLLHLLETALPLLHLLEDALPLLHLLEGALNVLLRVAGRDLLAQASQPLLRIAARDLLSEPAEFLDCPPPVLVRLAPNATGLRLVAHLMEHPFCCNREAGAASS
jgi:hypothetical protein